MRRVSTALVAAAIGGCVAVCGVAVHRQVWRLNGLPVPWGILLGCVTAFMVVRAAWWVGGLAASAGAAAGWVVLALVVQHTRPEGDVLVLGDNLGLGYLLGGMLTVAVGCVRGVRGGFRPSGASETTLES